jgi:hypothetical protein
MQSWSVTLVGHSQVWSGHMLEAELGRAIEALERGGRVRVTGGQRISVTSLSARPIAR